MISPVDTLFATSAADRTVSALVQTAADTMRSLCQNEAFYGPLSSKVFPLPAQEADAVDLLTGNCLFQTLLLSLFALYCLLLHRYRGPIRLTLGAHINRKTEERIFSDPGRHYERFLRFGLFACYLAIGCAVTAMTEKGLEGSGIGLPAKVIPLFGLITTFTVFLLAALQTGVLLLAGRLTLSDRFTSCLIRIKQINLATLGIVLAPVVLLSRGASDGWSDTLIYIALTEFCLTTVVFLYETWVLFVRQNVSLLHWILYLCTVEIFPVSLVVSTVLKIV